MALIIVSASGQVSSHALTEAGPLVAHPDVSMPFAFFCLRSSDPSSLEAWF